MRWIATVALVSLMAASCDGNRRSAPTPTPTPVPTPAPTPTPSVSYLRFSELAGDQQFLTSCAGLRFEGNIIARPATRFGDGFSLSYSANDDTFTVPPNTFGPADLIPGSPPGTRSYSNSRGLFSVFEPVAGGTRLEYARNYTYSFLSSAWVHNYSCIFGVPMAAEDRLPGTAFFYPATAVGGEAYVTAGTHQRHMITNSTASLIVDPTAGTVAVTIQLIGIPGGAGGAPAPVPLGAFYALAPIEPLKPTVFGSFTSADRQIEQSSVGGWFFGPQGKEIAMSFQIAATDPATGLRMSAAGAVFGVR